MRMRSFIMAFVCAFLFTAAAYSQTTPATDQAAQPQVVAKPGQLGFDVNGWKLNIYGFVKIDGVYNTANVLEESTPLYVMYSGDGPANVVANKRNKDDSFLMSLRTSRIGLKITAPTFLKATPTGIIEMDFWGQMPISGSAVRQGGVRMRHALVRLDWPTKTYFMVGQYWSIVMPEKVMPDTLAFIPLGASGLLFMREPQITIGQGFAAGSKFNGMLEVGIARAMAGDDAGIGAYTGSTNSQIEDRGAGEASAMPGYRARFTLELRPIDKMEIIVGGTGSYQQEKIQKYTAPTAAGPTWGNLKRIDSYVGSGFLKIAYHLFSVYGQAFYGQDIDCFFAGIMQGQTNKGEALQSIGGWGEVSLDLNRVQICPIKLSAGYGAEKILNSGLEDGVTYTKPTSALQPRVFNSTIFANIWYLPSPFYKVGFEFGKHSTKYVRVNTLDDYRYQFSFQFVF